MDNKITLNNLVYSVLEYASSGSLPDDMSISWEFAKDLVEQQRAILISQSLTKHDEWNDSFVQNFCAELESIDSSQCPCQVPIDCYVLRTKQRIPSTVDYYKDNAINSVTTVTGQAISKSNPVKSRYQKYNKYTSNNRIWFIKDNYMYILNEKFIDYINISGIFERPTDLKRFSCSGQSCFDENSEYPVSLNLASQIIDIINKTKIAPFFQFPADSSNNANSETNKQVIEQKQAGK